MANAYDFTYTGMRTKGLKYNWDFGPDASPSHSSKKNPSNIVFTDSGPQTVSLNIMSSIDDDGSSKDKGSKDDDSSSKAKGSKDDDSSSKGKHDDDSSSRGKHDDDSSSRGKHDDDSSSKADKGSKDDDSSGKGGKGQKDVCLDVSTQIIEVPEIKEGKKIMICHDGLLIAVSKKSLKKHLKHGDCIGSCESGSSKTSFLVSDQNSGNHLTIYPNPFQSSTRINFSIDKGGKVVVDLYDVTGSRVARLYSAYAEPGKTYTSLIKANDLRAGLYFIQLVSGDIRMYDRVVILK